MPASPITTQYTRFALLVFLPVIIFGFGCGDAGNINPNLPDAGMVGPTGNTDPPGAPETTEAVVINEIFPEASQIELHNPTSASVDISGFWLCHTTPALIYTQMPDNTIIDPDGFLIVNWGINGTNSADEIFTFPTVPIPMNVPHGEIGFYVPFGFDENNFADSDLIRDYVQWGEADHFRQGVAVGADIWPERAFVPSPPAGQSFSFNGSGDSPESWVITPPTIGIENNIP
ncbi:MAG TPA: lamin tail domain-containing protein [Nitrospirales bacterium]|nr:lamin tail domain-containing protein [Nitrospirales bacterium]HIN33633.1 lamin tail domain-containing protein [Nitrospirales bacterium]HIO22214.1 lamin tail domain-containing protein [Nitrospirales bacterium]